MVGSAGSPAEIKSSVVATNIDNLNKKRKLQDGLPEMPFPKHVCWDQSCDSSSESCTYPNRFDCNKFTAESEDSNCCSTDSIMSTDDEAKTNPRHQEQHTSDDPSTSSLSWGGTFSSEIDRYSSESRTMTRSGSIETGSESLSINEQPSCPYHQCAWHSSEIYHLEFEGLADCTCSEYKNNANADKELEDLLYSSGVDPKNYVLSSGRWSVNQDAQPRQGGEKLTIDKEFEQYFSMLML